VACKPWRTTKPDGGGPISSNATSLRAARTSSGLPDSTYLRSWNGLGFFASVLDAYSRMIVGWRLVGHMRTDLVLDAPRMALDRREPGADIELVDHSDRASQYTSVDYTQTLADHRVLAAVGSVGDAYDNALAET
jgi:putative transposase